MRDVPTHRRNAPGFKSVELSGQYRFVDNSIAGTEDVWGLGLKWEVVDGFSLRASRSRNFRAPTLYQLFAPSSTAAVAKAGCCRSRNDHTEDEPGKSTARRRGRWGRAGRRP